MKASKSYESAPEKGTLKKKHCWTMTFDHHLDLGLDLNPPDVRAWNVLKKQCRDVIVTLS